MENFSERPVCHRSEDLVTYLYNEASEADAQDFASHIEACEACRKEFAVFRQVHESILVWRNEALGSAFNPAAAAVLAEATPDSRRFVRHERKLSAFAALREFFSVSPLWLRGATAFAALLLCLLAALAISRLSQSPNPVATNEGQPKFSQQQFDQEVQKRVDEKVATLNRQNRTQADNPAATNGPKQVKPRVELAANQSQPRTPRFKGLSRQERVQLAADLRLTPGRDDEELPLVLPDEPNSPDNR